MKKNAWIIALIALSLGVWFDIIFFKANYVGLNIFLAEIAFLGAAIGLAYYTKQQTPIRSWVAAGFALAYSATFVFWTSELGLTLSAFGFLMANILFVIFMIGYQAHFKHPIDLIKISTLNLARHLLGRAHVLCELKPAKLSNRGTSIAIGVGISIPILIVFIALFANADAVVDGILKDFSDWLKTFTDVSNSIRHAIMIGFFTFGFLLFFAAAFWQRFEIKALQERVPKGKIESAIVLGSVNLLFTTFLIIQAVYLFGGQAAFDAIEGITYSEYVRQGFTQLTVVAVLVVLLSLTLRWIHSERTKGIIVALHLSLIVETVLIMISAFIRLQLYIDAYNYTPTRLFGMWMLIVIAVLFGMMFVNIVRNSGQEKLIRNGLLVIGTAALFFTMSTPDATAVKLNIARATADNPLDPFPLFDDLSAEAVPIMLHVFESGEVPISGILDE
ncbi:MAG: DUF4173 domain-containing protein, partial [Patescibacteria group bacterium]